MKLLLGIFLGILALSSTSFGKERVSICKSLEKAVASGSPSQKLKKYFDEQWKDAMLESPEWATYMGYPGQNDRWSDYSLATIERQEKETVCELKALQKIRRESLKGEERISYDLARRRLERSLEGQKFPGEYLVMDHLGGVHTEIVEILGSMPTATLKDYDDRLARLSKVPDLVAQLEILMREGIRRKVTPVKMFLSRIPPQFESILTAKIEDSPLYETFKEIRADLSPEKKAELQKKAAEVLKTKTYPALQQLKDFLVKEYIPGAQEKIAFSEMPQGKEWYAYNVKGSTTTNFTPDQLHELGLNEVSRITQEMEAIKKQVQFKGDLKAFNKFLLTEARFYYGAKEDLLRGYRDIAKRIDPELPRLFKTLPRLPYGVKEVPDYKAKDSPTAYYEGGSLEGGRAGYFVANTYDLKARPKWGMEALTCHEAVPGHHLQIAVAQELQGLPLFRKNAGYTAYSEGWGLYAESLCEELGLYKDPYAKYGQLTYEIWRAVRLVIDTGIHAKGWSRDRAIQYFMSTMPKSELEAQVEVDRYISWPGQALAYKVGELKFKELREKARTQLKSKFDIREYHEEVLRHGPLPMDVLETTFNEWLKKQNP